MGEPTILFVTRVDAMGGLRAAPLHADETIDPLEAGMLYEEDGMLLDSELLPRAKLAMAFTLVL